MVTLNTIKNREGARKARTRVGRGIGSGKGKTGGRGVKGQTSRSGVAIKGFEGGQMPIHRRLPKRGFNNPFAVDLNELNLGMLQAAIERGQIKADAPITLDVLVSSGLLAKKRDGVKLLAKGELKSKVQLVVTKASAKAVELVQKAGGSVEVLAKDAQAA